MSDAFLFMKCSCGYSCWSLHVDVNCPKCKKLNKAVTREDQSDWFEKSVIPRGANNEQPNGEIGA